MLAVGGTLMIMGMGTVFSFLVILVISMCITYKCLTFINKIFPEAVVEQAPAKKTNNQASDVEVAIALAATKAL